MNEPSSDESLAASSIIMPRTVPQSTSVPSPIEQQFSTSSMGVLSAPPSEADSSVSLLDVPSSDSDDDDDDVEMISDTASNRRMGSIHGTQPKDPTIYSTMKELNMHTLKNWEDIIMNINTVEQVKDSGLMVYFTTSVKKKKFYQLL